MSTNTQNSNHLNKTKNITNLESDSHTNQNPKKYDKNGDEIVWEIQLPNISSNLAFVILSWIFRIATLALICYVFTLGTEKYIHSQKMEWYKESIVLCLAMIFIYIIGHSVDSIFTA